MALSTTRNSPVGRDIDSWAPGFAVRGVIIDNPSGWWLQLQPGGYYVPPFTFGWRTALNGVLSVSINCVQGPGALISQNIGEPISVTLTQEQTDNWNGYTTLGPGAITADLIAAGVVIVGTINEVTNDGATVVIDINGITITDGFLILQDEFGRTVLSGSGFSGSWSQFVRLGIYNGAFMDGIAGAVPLGRTAALPYWTVTDVNAGATLTFQDPGVRFTFGALNDSKEMTSDLVPVHPGESLSVQWVGDVNRAAGTITVELELTLFDITQTFSSSFILRTDAFTGTQSFSTFVAGMDVPSGNYFAQVTVRCTETGSHSVNNRVDVDGVGLVRVQSTDGPNVLVFTAGNTWTPPPNLHHIVVEVVGGGGAGGSCQATGAAESSCGGGGGGGGYAKATIPASLLVFGATYTITRGAGGTAGAAGNNAGNAGGNSSFAGSGITTVQGNGGGGGDGSAANTGPERNAGGAGGSATGGDLNVPGGDGGAGIIVRGDAGQGDVGSTGWGGNNPLAGITQGRSSSGNGTTGSQYGGGGAGGFNANSQATARTGGVGANGVVIVTEYYTP